MNSIHKFGKAQRNFFREKCLRKVKIFLKDIYTRTKMIVNLTIYSNNYLPILDDSPKTKS